MSKKYFVWKDRNCNGVNPEWIEMSGKEFFRFIKNPENSNRKFEVIDNRVCQEADILTIEVTEEKYRDYCKRRRHERYLDDYSKNSAHVSIEDFVSSDKDMTYEETIADEVSDIEANAESKLLSENIRAIIDSLDEKEKKMANLLLLAYKTGKSEREICRILSVDQGTFRYYKKKIFKYIEKSFTQNE